MEVFVKGKSDYAPEYSSQRFSGDSEDMDFNDVFGGPPKRFSMQEVRVRYSFGDSEDDKASSPWIALKEKPVFGEESSTRRRRQGGGFFDDIFRVDESRSSPRRTNNLTGSNPGSRIMSPARPLPPTAEPFGTSLPAQFSLPAKSTKFPEYPTFASPNNIDVANHGLNSSHSSSASLSRFSSQANLVHEEIKNEVLPVYRQSPLSRQGSGMDMKSVDINNNQFHFSIYKWAGKGVPMLIPLVGRNNSRTKNISRNEPSKNLESLKTEREENDSRGRDVKSQENEKASVVLEAARLNVKIERVKSVDEIGVVKKSENEVSMKMEKSINDEAHQPGNVTEMKENKSRNPKNARKNAKKNEGARIESSRDNKLPEYSLQGMMKNATKSEGARIDSNIENVVHDKSRVTGKVKDFVQIFNQEADSGPKADFQTRNSSSRRKSVKIDQKQNEVDENLNKDETQQSTSTKTAYQRNEHFTTKSAYSSESLKRNSKISMENSDDPFEDNFLVQELSHDLEKATQSDEGSVDMKEVTDAKIRQWSFGRKGNIRSLLSTLQLVLWPESGWKPVPLMDLIEANAVKRAYQKALLRLHPDKLQQKGADSHHKYIAEKVFDILQEAWDHFNTVAPI